MSGTFANCAGGTTPWGTVLSAEENINYYFGNLQEDNPEYENHKNMGIDKYKINAWWKHDKRFDVAENPNEPNRFGWVVEVDPYNPEKPAVKRTALGRFKHECATTTIAPDGRVVVYSGDDEYDQYIYRFVTAKPWDSRSREKNSDLLDEGVLSVARFDEDGTLSWLPLVHGANGLDKANGFASQAECADRYS